MIMLIHMVDIAFRHNRVLQLLANADQAACAVAAKSSAGNAAPRADASANASGSDSSSAIEHDSCADNIWRGGLRHSTHLRKCPVATMRRRDEYRPTRRCRKL